MEGAKFDLDLLSAVDLRHLATDPRDSKIWICVHLGDRARASGGQHVCEGTRIHQEEHGLRIIDSRRHKYVVTEVKKSSPAGHLGGDVTIFRRMKRFLCNSP